MLLAQLHNNPTILRFLDPPGDTETANLLKYQVIAQEDGQHINIIVMDTLMIGQLTPTP